MSLLFSFDLKRPDEVRASSPEDEITLRGTRPCTIILVHGLTGTPNEMRYLAYFLHRQGYSVICPRLARHGEPLQQLKRVTWQELYASVREVFVAELATGNRVFVGGLSMSALFVLLLAEEFGDRFAGGICLAPTLKFDGWNVPWYHRLLPVVASTPLKYHLYFKESPPYGIKNEKVRQMVHTFYSRARLDDIKDIAKYGYAFFPVSLFHELQRLARTVVPMLDRVQAPMLLIHPREDDTASLRNSQLIHDRISSAHKKFVVLENSYHVITADQQRDDVAREIKAFMREVLGDEVPAGVEPAALRAQVS